MADLDGAAGTSLASDLTADGLDVRSVELDVADVEAVRAVVAAVDAESPLATVVASAGVAFARPLLAVEPDEYDRLMAVNVRGVFFVVQAAPARHVAAPVRAASSRSAPPPVSPRRPAR